jgi:hypothetical protein
VFCGERLLVNHLRPGKLDQAKHAWAILSLLVERLRQAWPGVRVVFRGDSGFCRHKMLSWCARKGVGYSAGLAKNPRYLVTNLDGAGQGLYEKLYGARGDIENRIKGEERPWRQWRRVSATNQLDLFAPHREPVEGPHQLPQLVAQPVPAIALESRRHAARDDPPHRARRHRHGPRPGRQQPSEALEDRRRHHPQHPAGALASLQRLPRQDPVHAGRGPARPRIAVNDASSLDPEAVVVPCNTGARPKTGRAPETARADPPRRAIHAPTAQ